MRFVLSKSKAVLFLIALLFLVQGLAFAGITGKISGIIKDANTGERLIGVNVLIIGTAMGGVTDVNGDYFIINIPPGFYDIQASLISHEKIVKTGIRVTIDHTTPMDFALKPTVIPGQEVTVVGEREIIQMDMSATQIAASSEQIRSVPMVRNVTQYIGLQAGIQGETVRGGDVQQSLYLMDGLVTVDNRINQPMRMVNVSSIKEVNIVKGGYTAEYGNLRSGLYNIVTKEGDFKKYTASFDLRYTPAYLKHSGESIFNWKNYFLRPFLDPQVAFVGTAAGWDQNTVNQYQSFIGWNTVSKNLLADKDPNNNMTPEQARDLFLYLHRAEGSGALGQKEGKYGNKPDWFGDGSVSGPVPLIGKYLGDLSFFASYADDWQQFALPTSREYYRNNNGMFKLTSHVAKNIKVTADAMYGETQTVAKGRAGADAGWVGSGQDILNSSYMEMGNGDRYGLYFPGFFTPYTLYNGMFGLSMDHVLNPKTFYQVRLSYVHTNVRAMQGLAIRNPAIVRSFGSWKVDEAPFGVIHEPITMQMQDNMYYDSHCDGARENSHTWTTTLKVDLTSQVNRYHQLKFGFLYNYDDLSTYQEFNRWESTWENYNVKWRNFPVRIGAYAQDKIEFQGLIANVGLRLDYSDPNVNWVITDEHYSKYFRYNYENLMFKEMKTQPAKKQVLLSPRIGISHPISANAKLYFNYGHFFSLPSAEALYKIDYYRLSDGPRLIGNPSLLWPKTVSYELGADFNLANSVLFHIAGYYKDNADQTARIMYSSYDRLVNYETWDNTNYQDIRGVEIQLEKTFGAWVTGLANYTYEVQTSGYIGRYQYYEDQREQAIYGLQNPYLTVPLPRPYARVLLNIDSPRDFGPTVMGFKPLAGWHAGGIFRYQSGRYDTWDPLTTTRLKDNLHWKSNYSLDARFSKMIRTGRLNMEVFLDITNLWYNKEGNWCTTSNIRAFADDTDRRRYLESLHLPQYKDDIYRGGNYVGGDDRAGMLRPDGMAFSPWEFEKANPNNDATIAAQNADIRSRNDKRQKDKSYIDNPNRNFLMYLWPRFFTIGVRIDL